MSCWKINWSKFVALCNLIFLLSPRWNCWGSVKKKLISWKSNWTVAPLKIRCNGRANIWRNLCLLVACSLLMKWSTWLELPRERATKVRSSICICVVCVVCSSPCLRIAAFWHTHPALDLTHTYTHTQTLRSMLLRKYLGLYDEKSMTCTYLIILRIIPCCLPTEVLNQRR